MKMKKHTKAHLSSTFYQTLNVQQFSFTQLIKHLNYKHKPMELMTLWKCTWL